MAKPYRLKTFLNKNIIEDLSFSDIYQQSYNKKLIKCKTFYNKAIMIEFPELLCLGTPYEKNNNYEMNLPLFTTNENDFELIQTFFSKISTLIVKNIKGNYHNWFSHLGQQLKKIRYIHIIKKTGDDYVLNLKIDKKCIVIDNNQIVTPEHIKTNTYLKIIFQFVGVYILDNLIGIVLDPVIIYQRQSTINNTNDFIDYTSESVDYYSDV